MKDFLTLQEFNKRNRQNRINFLILTLVRLYNGKYKFIELTLFYLQILQTKKADARCASAFSSIYRKTGLACFLFLIECAISLARTVGIKGYMVCTRSNTDVRTIIN